MRKLGALLAFIACTAGLEAKKNEVYGRSYMYIRPASYNLAMHNQLWHAIAFDKKSDQGGAFQLISFYESSLFRQKVARYFLFEGKNSLLVAGDNALQELTNKRDVRAEWLGLPSDFSGVLTVHPQQRQLGFTLEYSQDLSAFTDAPFIRDWWFDIEFPVIMAESTLGLCQSDVRNPGDGVNGPADIIQAFNQPKWHFSHAPGVLARTRLAEIRLRLGTTYLHEDFFEISYYGLASFPTGNKPEAQYFFGPVAGNGGHFCWGGGVDFQLLLNRNPEQMAWCFFLSLETALLVRNTQCRIFDLKKKPWSRFMLYNIEGCPPDSSVPGVNLLTLPVRSRPYNLVDFTMGWRTRTGLLELEMGYNVWGHGEERVRLTCPILTSFGIAGTGAGPNNTARTSSLSTIKTLAVDDPVFVRVTEEDLDFCSPAAASTIVQKVHAAAGLVHEGENCGGFLGLGVHVDIPHKNRPLELWGAWVKLGATF